jgi:hypothetical protein
MSARLLRNLPLLKLLLKATPKQRRVILEAAADELIVTLCEVALNVVHGNIPLTPQQYQKLKRRRSEIKIVADKKVGVRRKRRLINQQGGFLLPLLSAAIPFITSLITSK